MRYNLTENDLVELKKIVSGEIFLLVDVMHYKALSQAKEEFKEIYDYKLTVEIDDQYCVMYKEFDKTKKDELLNMQEYLKNNCILDRNESENWHHQLGECEPKNYEIKRMYGVNDVRVEIDGKVQFKLDGETYMIPLEFENEAIEILNMVSWGSSHIGEFKYKFFKYKTN